MVMVMMVVVVVINCNNNNNDEVDNNDDRKSDNKYSIHLCISALLNTGAMGCVIDSDDEDLNSECANFVTSRRGSGSIDLSTLYNASIQMNACRISSSSSTSNSNDDLGGTSNSSSNNNNNNNNDNNNNKAKATISATGSVLLQDVPATTSGVLGCDSCGFTTRRKADLVRHARIHTGERPYVCPLCRHSYTRKDNLRNHLFAKHFRQVETGLVEMPSLLAAESARSHWQQ